MTNLMHPHRLRWAHGCESLRQPVGNQPGKNWDQGGWGDLNGANYPPENSVSAGVTKEWEFN